MLILQKAIISKNINKRYLYSFKKNNVISVSYSIYNFIQTEQLKDGIVEGYFECIGNSKIFKLINYHSHIKIHSKIKTNFYLKIL